MAEASDSPKLAGTDARILAEHRRIRDLTQQIESAGDLPELLGHLEPFRSLLELHFMGEEVADGLYDAIRAMAPRQIARLSQLEKEHRAFLADLDRVADHARQCLAGPVADVLNEARGVVQRLLAHERAEDDVLMDTMYTDLGQGD
jgi:hypothetical protein